MCDRKDVTAVRIKVFKLDARSFGEGSRAGLVMSRLERP